VHLNGFAIPTTSHFTTPLGQVMIDKSFINKLIDLDSVHFMDEAHADEHCIEIQLPFLQVSLPEFTIVPVVVGNASTAQVETLLDLIWGGDDTLIVISTDLSHFLDYQSALVKDAQTATLIEKMAYDKLKPDQACGARPLGGLLKRAKRENMNIERLGMCNSADTAGNRERVVGYGAWALYDAQNQAREREHILLTLARQSIEHGFTTSAPLQVDNNNYPMNLRQPAACFVTLETGGKLRGCIGHMEASQSLVKAVADSAFKAAFRDPRFEALTEQEYPDVSLSISILTPQFEIFFQSDEDILKQLRPQIDGLTIKSGRHQATFLPSVWEKLPQPDQFLAHLKNKAGIASGQQIEQAWVYNTEIIC
jgi:AmmeMemoRadiSam system protein A